MRLVICFFTGYMLYFNVFYLLTDLDFIPDLLISISLSLTFAPLPIKIMNLRSLHIFTLLVTLMLIASCSEKDTPVGGGIVTFSGKVCEDWVSESGDEKLTKVWETNDKVKILWSGGYTYAQALGGRSQSKFSVQGDPIPEGKLVYYAVYPSSMSASLDADGSLILNYKSGRKATLAYSRIMVACSSSPDGTFDFYNAGSVFSFESDDETLAEVSFSTAASTPVAGDVKFSFRGGKIASTKLSGNTTEISSKITVSTGTSYVALPPTTDGSEGWILSFYNADGGLITRLTEPRPADFSRGRLFPLGNVENLLKRDVVKVLYHNIFLKVYEGSVYPRRKWDYRKPGVVAMLKAQAPQVFALNECDYEQRQYIATSLPSYGVVGVGPDGSTTGYKDSSNPVFYDKGTLDLKSGDWGSFWLSDTPDKVSYTWGQTASWKQQRYCTWCRFTHKASGKRFAFFVTHLANGTDGLESRKKSLGLLAKKVAELAPDMPAVIGGDFNSSGSEDYYPSFRSLFKEGRRDCVKADSGTTHLTFTDGDFEHLSASALLDHIYYKELDGLEFAIDRNPYANIQYISDHYPVWARLRITN